MRMISLAATPVAFFLPSRSARVTIGKLAFILLAWLAACLGLLSQ